VGCVRLRGIGIVLAMSALARTAHADDARRLLVHYEAAPGCPSADAFRADLARRTPRIVMSNADDAERYDVVIPRRGPSRRQSRNAPSRSRWASMQLPAVFDPGLVGVVVGVESRPAAGAPIPVLLRVRVILAAQGTPSDERLSRIALSAIGVDACVFELARAGFSIRPCVGLEPGIAWAETHAGANASAFWLSLSGWAAFP
jgi:hypothetical protein